MDKVFSGFLNKQFEEGMKLASESDILELEPMGPPPYQAYLAGFHCRGLVKAAGGEIREADYFKVGIFFPDDYLRRAMSREVLLWLSPKNIFHSNISPKTKEICVGRIRPGTELVNLCFSLYALISYQLYSLQEGYNFEAAVFGRTNIHRFPVDSRPLRRRQLDLDIEVIETGGEE